MNSRSRWQLPCRAANRCGGWGQSSPARCSASWGWGPPGPKDLTTAKPSAGAATGRNRMPVWRPAGIATATPPGSVAPAGAATLAPIMTSATAEAAGTSASLVNTRRPPAFPASVSTPAWWAPSIAMGHAPIWPMTSTTAAPAGTCVRTRRLTALTGSVVQIGVAEARSIARIRLSVRDVPIFSLTATTAARAVSFAGGPALMVCAILALLPNGKTPATSGKSR